MLAQQALCLCQIIAHQRLGDGNQGRITRASANGRNFGQFRFIVTPELTQGLAQQAVCPGIGAVAGNSPFEDRHGCSGVLRDQFPNRNAFAVNAHAYSKIPAAQSRCRFRIARQASPMSWSGSMRPLHQSSAGPNPRFQTNTTRSKVQTTWPCWFLPVVRMVTMPCSCRFSLSRFSRTSVSE